MDLSIGDSFSSFAELEQKVKSYQVANYVQLWNETVEQLPQLRRGCQIATSTQTLSILSFGTAVFMEAGNITANQLVSGPTHLHSRLTAHSSSSLKPVMMATALSSNSTSVNTTMTFLNHSLIIYQHNAN